LEETDYTIEGYNIKVVRLDCRLDLASAWRGNEGHWMLLDDRNKVRDLLSVLLSFDGKSMEDIETPPAVLGAMRSAIDRFRSSARQLQKLG
jgi:hypothetical protein